MEENKVHIRHILLFCFRKGRNAAQTRREICDVYGAEAVTPRMCQFWFNRFRNGKFDLEDSSRSGRPIKISDDQILELIKNNCHYTIREIGSRLNISHAAVAHRLKTLGMVKRADIWIPNELVERKLL